MSNIGAMHERREGEWQTIEVNFQRVSFRSYASAFLLLLQYTLNQISCRPLMQRALFAL